MAVERLVTHDSQRGVGDAEGDGDATDDNVAESASVGPAPTRQSWRDDGDGDGEAV